MTVQIHYKLLKFRVHDVVLSDPPRLRETVHTPPLQLAWGCCVKPSTPPEVMNEHT